MDFLTQLDKQIQKFEDKGNPRKDCMLIMGITFYQRFLEECKKASNRDVEDVYDFMGVEVANSSYIEHDFCAIANKRLWGKSIDETWKREYRLKWRQDESDN